MHLIAFSSRLNSLALICLLSVLAPGSGALAAEPKGQEHYLGLYPASDFQTRRGECVGCAASEAALWYFRGETLAVPVSGAEGFSRGMRAFDDVRAMSAQPEDQAAASRPPLVWITATQKLRSARIAPGGGALTSSDGKKRPFALVPKIDTNLSYFNDASLAYFSTRPLDVRGELVDGKFVVGTVWPADYALGDRPLSLRPLNGGESLDTLIRAEQGGAQTPMAARLLWQRDPKSPLAFAGKPVLAMVLNGAQGDDDEALGGHFAVATGRFGAKGDWGDWIVNNFYNLDSVSEKGIIASSLPLDNYQGDLNRGQSWYRPSYFLVAVLKDAGAAARFQQAISRVLNHFYQHDVTYQHATANCAGLSMETLRALGWEIPKQGPTSRLKAVAALPLMSIKEWSLDSGKKAVDYLMTEQTSLYPMAAFQAAGNDLLTRIAQGQANTPYEKQLAADLEAIVYIRIPQFPSSRAFGNAPVASIDEYMSTAPENRADWKIVPVAPRPFPAALRDPQSPTPELAASSWTLAGYGAFLGVGGMGVWHRRRKKRKNVVNSPRSER